jgi:hypothetical protein
MSELNINLATGAVVSEDNGTNVALNDGQTYTGTAEDVSKYTSVVVAVKTDTDFTMYADFSVDGTNWDSSLPYVGTANLNEVHRLTVTRRYFRLRIVNDSGVNQTYLRAQVLLGAHQSLTSNLNATIQEDADTLLVRPLDFNLMVSERLYLNREVTIKDGFNPDIDAASVPEDIWDNGGVYTGFVTAAGAAECVVAGADTGTVFYAYLETPDSTNYVFDSVAVAGAGTYSLGHNIWRCNFAYFVASDNASFNAGVISIRLTATPASVFVTIPVGYSQSYCAAYSVPAGSEVFLDRVTGSVRGSTSGAMDGAFYYKPWDESPRMRFPFELQFGSLYFDDIDYLIRVPERVDLMPRIMVSSTNNLNAKVSYRVLKVRG